MATRTFGFGFKAFKRFPELIPLAVIIGTTSTMATCFVAYSLKTKPDVRLVGRNVEMPYEMVKPTESRKPQLSNDERKNIIQASSNGTNILTLASIFKVYSRNIKRLMININQKYEPIPELEALRKEIGSYKV